MRISDWSSDVCSSDLIAQIFSLLVQHAVSTLDRIGALQKVRLRFPVAADLAKTVKLRHIDGVLEDMAHFSVAILDRRMRRAPVALFDAPLGAGDRIGDQGKMIGLAGIEYRLRSEEHTSELQSLMRLSYAVFCLKKKNT